MNHSSSWPTFILWMILATMLTPERLFAADEAGQLETAFKSRHDAVNAQRDEQLAKLKTGYLAALNRQFEKVKASGKLEDALSVRDEIDAVKSGTDPLPALAANATYDLKQLRKTYDEAQAPILKTHASALSDIAGKMTEALKAEEARLTRAGKIDQALAAKKLRESIEQDEGINAARKNFPTEIQGKDQWVSLLKSKWEVELSEGWYVGDALGLKGKGPYLPEEKAKMAAVPDEGFPHFLAVPRARVLFKMPTKVTRFEAKVAMISHGDASLILYAGDKKVAKSVWMVRRTRKK